MFVLGKVLQVLPFHACDKKVEAGLFCQPLLEESWGGCVWLMGRACWRAIQLNPLLTTRTGDAAHPMTPNLGQGGCAALEDAVVLARELAKAKTSTGRETSQNGHPSDTETLLDPSAIENVLRSYERERIPRAAKLTVQSWVYGTLLQIGFPPVTFARDNVVVPYLFKPDHWLDHTLYDCGELPTS